MNILKPVGLAAFIMLAVIALFVPGARAQQDREHYPIGQIVALEGKAFYNADTKPVEMKLNDPVFLNTTVETGPASKVLIMFIDNTQITLGENAELLIDEFVFDPQDAEENKGKFEMTKGPFLWVSGLLSKRKDPQVEIQTRAGSIGIRGTKFWGGDVGENLYGLYVFDGLVHFATASGEIDLPLDTGVIVGDAHTPLNTESWPQPRLNDAAASVTFSDQTAVNKRIAAVKQENISRQNDYRARMFPYKHDTPEPQIKDKNGKFFSDEFDKFRNQKSP